MKKDIAKGRENRELENVHGGKPNVYPTARKHNQILSGLANLVMAIKRKTYFSYRNKKIHKDGSISETEIIYRNDD